jgi:hypothetical protein
MNSIDASGQGTCPGCVRRERTPTSRHGLRKLVLQFQKSNPIAVIPGWRALPPDPPVTVSRQGRGCL